MFLAVCPVFVQLLLIFSVAKLCPLNNTFTVFFAEFWRDEELIDWLIDSGSVYRCTSETVLSVGPAVTFPAAERHCCSTATNLSLVSIQHTQQTQRTQRNERSKGNVRNARLDAASLLAVCPFRGYMCQLSQLHIFVRCVWLQNIFSTS